MYGYIKVATAVPELKLGNCIFNTEQIIEKLYEAYKQKVNVIVFPELTLTGYTCGDLFFQQTLRKGAYTGLEKILEVTKEMEMLVAVGMPLTLENQLFNCAVLMLRGKILGIIPKQFIPNYNEFYEKRWFSSGLDLQAKECEVLGQIVPIGTDLLFKLGEHVCVGVEICEDLWTPIPPSSTLCMQGAELILNLSASNETISKRDYRRGLVAGQSARCICAYAYASAGGDESTTDIVFSGHSLIAENGGIVKENEKLIDANYLLIGNVDIEKLQADRYKNKSYMDCHRLYRQSVRVIQAAFEVNDDCLAKVARKPFVPHSIVTRDKRCEDIFTLQVAGLKRRLTHTGSGRVVIGISGGLDSTLALLVCTQAFEDLGWDKKDIIGVTMPGFGTTDRTYDNALALMKELGTTIREIPIAKACQLHFEDIGHDSTKHDITYENTQARERTQILMDIANQGGGMVIGTGDLSELALGWCTYNGDHMSMYAVNTSIPKTLVRSIVRTIAKTRSEEAGRVLLDVLDTPVSPELLPASKEGEILQKTESAVGPYELHDFFLYYMLRFGFTPSKIYALAKATFAEKEDASDCLYTDEEIKKWMKVFYRRFFTQQFKRSCLPDGPKVGSVCLSPRGDWRMPSDASNKLWLDEVESL